ncbi:MAG: hypothetical protein AB7O97_03100 [Planctomycetota bacterium]
MTAGPTAMPVTALGAAVLLAACASQEPLDMGLPAATQRVAVCVLGDGFVRLGDRRVPREAFVLELRQRARAMDASQLAGLRVELDVAADAGPDAALDAEWLLDQFQILGVGQVRYL